MKIQFKKHGRLIMYNGGQETGTMRDGEVKDVSSEVAKRLISDFPNNFNTPEGWKKEIEDKYKESEAKKELDKEEKKEKEHKGKAGDKKKEHSDGSKEKSEINI